MTASCAASSTSRVMATSSCRLRKTRTLTSANQLGVSSASTPTTWCRDFVSLSRTSPTNCRCPLARTTSTWASHNKVEPIPLSVTFSSAAVSLQDPSPRSTSIFLPYAALLAFTLGFVTATTSPSTTGSSESSSTGANFGRHGGGGGGGPTRQHSSIVADSRNSRKSAEEDVHRMEEEAMKNPYMVSAGILQGARWTMEDAYTVENGGRFVGVFDGHGGSEVSGMLRERLYELYRDFLSLKHWEERDDFDIPRQRIPTITSHGAALREALAQVEEDVLKDDELVYQGSTAVAIVLHVDNQGKRTLLSANVGDSRAVLSRKGKAVELTKDHKPNDERERARIRSMGEEVQWDPYGQVYRVRDLSLSRAIGDRFAKPYVSSEPEMKRFPLVDDKDEFILLASDGLWDVMTSQEAVDFVHYCLEHNEPKSPGAGPRKMMARLVANEALERGSADNVCVVVVWLNKESDAKN